MLKPFYIVALSYPLLAFGAPLDWSMQIEHFDKVYKPPQGCVDSVIAEMECSNFRSRALKRFQNEWISNSYWKNGKIIDNPSADRRVNSETLY